MKKQILSSCAAIVCFALGAIAQNSNEVHRCYTDEVFNYNVEQNPGLYEKWQKNYKDQIDYINANPVKPGQRAGEKVIPVVVHVIHNGEALGTGNNISDAQVQDAINLMNDDFLRTNADKNQTPAAFVGVAGSTNIMFELAKIDPSGNQTTGITRTQSSLTLGQVWPNTNNVKQLIKWPVDKYLNIWVLKVVNPVGLPQGGCCVTGAAEVPISLGQYDGVAIRNDMMGSIGTAATPLAGFNNPTTGQPFENWKGRTLTHEVGHYLGLFHLWGNAQSCGDDGISDTPKQNGPHSFQCPTFPSVSSCGASNAPNGDQFMNYMDYTMGNCENMFSIQQGNLMNSTLNGLRSVLASLANNTATGVGAGSPSFPPVSNFSSTATSVICKGGTVTFTDLSTNDPTSSEWTFPDGTAANPTQQNPTVTYANAGSYNVTLKATNNEGNNSKVLNNHVVVVSSDIKYPLNYTEGFENATTFINDWFIVNPDGDKTWSRFGAAGATGGASAKMENFGNTNGAVDELVSPVLDLSTKKDPVFTFKVAHVRKDNTSKDALKIYLSKDCGATWVLKLSKVSGQMSTGTASTSAYTPNAGTAWREFTVPLTGFTTDAVMIKFEFTSTAGNNLYIDDINITGDPLQGIEGFNEGEGLSIFPNPTDASSMIQFNMLQNKQIELSVNDLTGRTVSTIYNGTIGAGNHSFEVSKQVLGASGVYIINLNIEGQRVTKKLIIQ